MFVEEHPRGDVDSTYIRTGDCLITRIFSTH